MIPGGMSVVIFIFGSSAAKVALAASVPMSTAATMQSLDLVFIVGPHSSSLLYSLTR
jgi:hypothetical protein